MSFRPFSLADVIKDTQVIQLNKLKLATLQSGIQRKRDLRQMAATSTKPTYEDQPVYGEAEGPPTPEGEAPEIQTGTEQVRTGTEYDPEAHQEKLSRAGETEMAAKLEKHIGSMQANEREDFAFKAEEAAKTALTAKTPELWEAAKQKGDIPPDKRFEDRDFVINAGRTIKDIMNPSGTRGSSEFERLSGKLKSDGLTVAEQSRYDVLSGLKARPSTSPHSQAEIDGKLGIFNKETGKYTLPQDAGLTGSEIRSLRTTEEKQVARVNKATTAMRGEAVKGVEHAQSQRIAVRDALAALDAGNNQLADTMLTQILTGVTNAKSGLRAYAMYEEFDRSYGNLADRTFDAVSKFLGGERPPEDRKVIRDTLLNFKKHADPIAKNMRTKYRSLAKEEGLDPWRVVPPDSPEDVRDAPGIPHAEKLRILRRYYPEKFAK